MRPSNYARTPPEARQGFAAFAVRLVFVSMVGNLRASRTGVNGFSSEIPSTRLNQPSLSSNKLTNEPSQPF
jgi:hypothetical protein